MVAAMQSHSSSSFISPQPTSITNTSVNDTMLDDGDLSLLSELELRKLFRILRRLNPSALSTALAELYAPESESETRRSDVKAEETRKVNDTREEEAYDHCGDVSDGENQTQWLLDKNMMSDSVDDWRTPIFLTPSSKKGARVVHDSPNSTSSSTSLRKTGQEQASPTCITKHKDQVHRGQVEGCYLLYDSNACKLMIHYSKNPIPNAIGFWNAGFGHSIKLFKFKQNFGRAELIGNCASGIEGRKNYYSGWCQFVRAARAHNGYLRVIPRTSETQKGLDVDLYAYYKFHTDRTANGQQRPQPRTIQLPENVMFDVSNPPMDAVACLPRYTEFYAGVSNINLTRWMNDGNTIGAASSFEGSLSSSSRSFSSSGSFDDASGSSAPPPSSPHQSIRNLMSPPSPISAIADEDYDRSENAKVGCYLLYDSDGCKLTINYSKTAVKGAIGFWRPGVGHEIKGFKFKQNFGRSDLIGNCASGIEGRKNYYSGWCQFIRAAKALDGLVLIKPRSACSAGLDVDLYVYYKNGLQQTTHIQDNVWFDVSKPPIDAVACLPKHADFYEHVSYIGFSRWMTEGNNIGAASRFP